MFSLVLFEEDGMKLFEVVPDLWLQGKENCFWPPKGSKANSLKAVNQVVPNEETWELHPVKIISSSFS